MQSRLLTPVLAVLLLSGCPDGVAGEIVDAKDLSEARAHCTSAGMDSSVTTAQFDRARYEVTCVERSRRILLTSVETYAVQQCRSRGWNVRIEVNGSKVGVSCVVR